MEHAVKIQNKKNSLAKFDILIISGNIELGKSSCLPQIADCLPKSASCLPSGKFRQKKFWLTSIGSCLKTRLMYKILENLTILPNFMRPKGIFLAKRNEKGIFI